MLCRLKRTIKDILLIFVRAQSALTQCACLSEAAAEIAPFATKCLQSQQEGKKA